MLINLFNKLNKRKPLAKGIDDGPQDAVILLPDNPPALRLRRAMSWAAPSAVIAV